MEHELFGPFELHANAVRACSPAAAEAGAVRAILWNYDEKETCVTDLYELAKRKTWNASKDIPWTESRLSDSCPYGEEANPLKGFAPYDVLPEPEKNKMAWWHHSSEISEILHGEQAALVIASQLVVCLPTIEAKLFAGSQVFDEARHVEFFLRYLRAAGSGVRPPSEELRGLIEKATSECAWDFKFIACQVLIESLALARFQEMKHDTTVSILRFALDYIAKDEARHVRFGTEILRTHLAKMPQAELERRSHFVVDNALKLVNSQNGCVRMAAEVNWDATQFRRHLRLYRARRPYITRNRLRLLMRNLQSVGLFTSATQERFDALNALAGDR